MCRSLIVCLALVLGLVSTSFADILIGNFENSMSDNWVPAWEDTPTLESDTLGVGATLDDMSLQVHTSGGYWTLQCLLPVMPLGTDALAVSMDVTMIASEWNYEWTKIDKMAINSDGASGWKEYLPTSPADTSWGSWSGDLQRTIVWDMTESAYNSTGATYLQINFALQNPAAGKGAFYIDNVRIISDYLEGDTTGGGVRMPPCVPEPMTITMLGLGGLALIRRKK